MAIKVHNNPKKLASFGLKSMGQEALVSISIVYRKLIAITFLPLLSSTSVAG